MIGYDLSQMPITFDFVYWLMWLESKRREHSPDSNLDILFSTHKGFRRKTARDLMLSEHRKTWRLHNMLVPVTRSLPSVSSIVVTDADVYDKAQCPAPDMWRGIHKLPIAPLRASTGALSAISLMYKNEYVVVTLRQSDLQRDRNSNTHDVRSICRWLESRGENVVVVPDTEAELSGNRQSIWGKECVHAALNIDLRLALYERAKFCIFTNSGPCVLAHFDERVKYMLFMQECSHWKFSRFEMLGITHESNRGEYRNSYFAPLNVSSLAKYVEPFLRIPPKVDGETDVWSASVQYAA